MVTFRRFRAACENDSEVLAEAIEAAVGGTLALWVEGEDPNPGDRRTARGLRSFEGLPVPVVPAVTVNMPGFLGDGDPAFFTLTQSEVYRLSVLGSVDIVLGETGEADDPLGFEKSEARLTLNDIFVQVDEWVGFRSREPDLPAHALDLAVLAVALMEGLRARARENTEWRRRGHRYNVSQLHSLLRETRPGARRLPRGWSARSMHELLRPAVAFLKALDEGETMEDATRGLQELLEGRKQPFMCKKTRDLVRMEAACWQAQRVGKAFLEENPALETPEKWIRGWKQAPDDGWQTRARALLKGAHSRYSEVKKRQRRG